MNHRGCKVWYGDHDDFWMKLFFRKTKLKTWRCRESWSLYPTCVSRTVLSRCQSTIDWDLKTHFKRMIWNFASSEIKFYCLFIYLFIYMLLESMFKSWKDATVVVGLCVPRSHPHALDIFVCGKLVLSWANFEFCGRLHERIPRLKLDYAVCNVYMGNRFFIKMA